MNTVILIVAIICVWSYWQVSTRNNTFSLDPTGWFPISGIMRLLKDVNKQLWSLAIIAQWHVYYYYYESYRGIHVSRRVRLLVRKRVDSRWVHRESNNLIFTLSNDNDQRKNSLSLSWNEPLVWNWSAQRWIFSKIQVLYLRSLLLGSLLWRAFRRKDVCSLDLRKNFIICFLLILGLDGWHLRPREESEVLQHVVQHPSRSTKFPRVPARHDDSTKLLHVTEIHSLTG